MKKAVIYSVCVCLFSWAVFGAIYFATGRSMSSGSMLMQGVSVLYMFFPLILALLMQLVRKEKPSGTGLLNFKFSPAWLVAIAIPFAVLLLTILISTLFPGVRLEFGPEKILASTGLEGEAAEQVKAQFESMSPTVMLVGTLVSGLFAGCTVNAVAAFGEEYGWRNYMVDALRGQKFWKAALLIGIVWGIWHAPLILLGHNYPQHPVAGVPMMCGFCLLIGVLELYFVLKTCSVIPAALMHGVVNAISGTTMFLVQGGNDLTVGVPGASGFVAIAIVIACVWLYDRRHDRIMAKGILQE